ncbi:MAG: hypothetical protein MRY63_05555 [Neomegalonema sp.]|nr:hypothetical protein [Neomegalonema sp.]
MRNPFLMTGEKQKGNPCDPTQMAFMPWAYPWAYFFPPKADFGLMNGRQAENPFEQWLSWSPVAPLFGLRWAMLDFYASAVPGLFNEISDGKQGRSAPQTKPAPSLKAKSSASSSSAGAGMDAMKSGADAFAGLQQAWMKAWNDVSDPAWMENWRNAMPGAFNGANTQGSSNPAMAPFEAYQTMMLDWWQKMSEMTEQASVTTMEAGQSGSGMWNPMTAAQAWDPSKWMPDMNASAKPGASSSENDAGSAAAPIPAAMNPWLAMAEQMAAMQKAALQNTASPFSPNAAMQNMPWDPSALMKWAQSFQPGRSSSSSEKKSAPASASQSTARVSAPKAPPAAASYALAESPEPSSSRSVNWAEREEAALRSVRMSHRGSGAETAEAEPRQHSPEWEAQRLNTPQMRPRSFGADELEQGESSPVAAEPAGKKRGSAAALRVVEGEGKPAKKAAPAAKVEPEAEADDTTMRPFGLYETRPADADDLKRVRGIGPRLEQLLNELGVYTLSQIAQFSDAELRWLDEHLFVFRGRAMRDEWVSQAQDLIAKD